MEILRAKHMGFCFGVKKGIELANSLAGQNVCTYGKLIHNDYYVDKLAKKGIVSVENIEDITTESVIIRCHGVGKAIYERLKEKGINIFDATCPFVANIHRIVEKHFAEGSQIVIIGKADHAEVVGINGWCGNTAIIIETEEDCNKIPTNQKLCVVSQTTFSVEKYNKIINNISSTQLKTVEIFDTICYTTNERQIEACELAKKCDKMLIIGSPDSSNTTKLFQISQAICKDSYLISTFQDVLAIKFDDFDKIGITAGASTPDELIQEVLQYMEDKEIQFKDMLEESFVNYKKGTRINNAEIISSSASGITVKIGGKNDGFISADSVECDGEFDPSKYVVGSTVDVVIKGTKDKDTGLIPVSKRDVDAAKIGDKAVEGIRDNQEFQMVVTKVLEKGLEGRLGNYRVFVPHSHVAEHFVRDLSQYQGKTLRLRAISIDDAHRKIVASQKVILSEERKEKEDVFFAHVYPEAIVIGKVMRSTPFGAFVNVGGFDCLAHITDLSWNKINKVEEVLTIGEEYEFVVLKCDKENKKVSLGYKQLQQHPFDAAVAKYSIGQKVNGTVLRLAPFGAFIEIEKGLDGLVHISEVSNSFLKSINEALKVGDSVTAIITKISEENKQISLSIKAAQEPVVNDAPVEEQPKKARKGKAKAEDNPNPNEWNEASKNNVFADLFKEIKEEE